MDDTSSAPTDLAGVDRRARLAAAVRARRGSTPAIRSPFVVADRGEPLPLSYSQERMWFLNHLTGGGPAYHLPVVMRIRGELKRWALEDSLHEIGMRHESLRTTFPAVDGRPVQTISSAARVPLNVTDLSEVPAPDRERALHECLDEEVGRPFDLAQGPVWRAALVRLAADDHVVAVTTHHIVTDWWSVGVLFRELAIVYQCRCRGTHAPLPDLPFQFVDYAVSQRQWLSPGVIAAHLNYWKAQLAGAPALQLPVDRPRPAVQRYVGRTHAFALGGSVHDALRALGREEGTTLFMTALAAFATLLFRYSGQEDFVIGAPVSNRSRSETEGMVGLFVNMLPLRADLTGAPTFRTLLRRARRTCVDAYAHQDLPFEQLVEHLQPQRDPSRSPIFQVMLIAYDTPAIAVRQDDVTLEPMVLDTRSAKFDLSLYVREDRGTIQGHIEYNSDLFAADTAARMAVHLERLMVAAVADPDIPIADLRLMDDAERHQAVVVWNETAIAYARDAGVPERFDAVVGRHGSALAIVCGDQRLTYDALNRRANRLAHSLIAAGVRRGAFVATLVERSAELVVAQLGILKAGATYVPLQPTYPPARLAFMLADTGAAIVVTRGPSPVVLPSNIRPLDVDTLADGPDDNPPIPAAAGDVATVLYTSGSTGEPKGVLLPHRGIVRLVTESGFVRMQPDDVWLHHSNISFDSTLLEVWGALLNGGTLVVMPPTRAPADDMARLIRAHRVTTLWLTAGIFHAMVDERLDDLAPLSQLIAGGDVLSPKHVRRFVQRYPRCRFVNGYGPTENSTFSCTFAVERFDEDWTSVPIGRPIANSEAYIVDRSLEPVPIGVPGELYVAGDGLALGYLNRPELTAERFSRHQFARDPGRRWYRTGDRCRYLPDGTIEFLGRLDHQVKIRGFRLEPGELQAVLLQHPRLRDAAVVIGKDAGGDTELLAYVVPLPDGGPSDRELRQYLRERVPDFMMPAAIAWVEALPLTANGKLDRAALPPPHRPRVDADLPRVEPRTATEAAVIAIWREVLQREHIGLEENFFDIGGHSLLAMRLQGRLEAVFGRKLNVIDLFEHSTIESLARFIDEGPRDRPSD